MSIRRFVYLVALVVACGATACTPTSHNPNIVSFGTGETVGHATTYQFLSIASDFAWSIGIEYVAPEGESDWCNLNKTEGEGNANVVMSFGKNELSEDRTLKLTVTFPNESIELLFTQRSASSQTDQNDLSGWLELPSFQEDGTRYYFSKHMLPSQGNKKRSFSLFYDADIYHSLWVAYPLYREVIGSGNRTNDWGIYDPNIPSEKQLYMSSSYQGSYDRGHLLPSASRAKSTADNSATFYPTNMSPQLAGLNQRKWSDIEIQVRNWAKNGCDTLYVVTGAVFQTVGGSESVSYTYCKSDSSKDVAIPNYYYKALLQLRGGSYEAMAIWVPHRAAEGEATLNDIITIDLLEERTGIDFFPNLKDDIENVVESKVNSHYWGL